MLALLHACGGGGGGSAGPAPTEPVPVAVTVRTSALANPWGMAFLPDGRMLVTERGGRLKLLSASGAVQGEFINVPAVVTDGQGGLMDVALDPGFASNRRI